MPQHVPPFDVVILGGGAAGLMCAATAGKRGKRVCLIERNPAIGEKIRISGGGRCNFTNRDAAPEQFISSNPDFVLSPLSRYPPLAFIAEVEAHHIAYHEKKLGQLFCDKSSREIIDYLSRECREHNVQAITGCEVTGVEKSEATFTVATTKHGLIQSNALVVATGGLSIPKIGATDFGYKLASQFGLRCTALRPGLVPFVLSESDLKFLRPLAGTALDVEVSCSGISFQEAMLFTHRGLSGPAILQISSYWREGDEISINLLPNIDALEFISSAQTAGKMLAVILASVMPQRIARAWCEMNAAEVIPARCSKSEREHMANALASWMLRPIGTEGYEKAEVTVGGVDTRDLSSKTMEARAVPGLYFIGEVVDVTGWLGGYNFQWAWASGVAAGNAI